MASASHSATWAPALEHFCCSQASHKGNRELKLDVDGKMPKMRAKGAPRTQLLFQWKTRRRLFFANEKELSSTWNDCIQLLGKSKFTGLPLGNQHTHLIKAVAMAEPKCLVPNENEHKCDSDLQFGFNSDSQMLQFSCDDSPEMDERERLRRLRISKANKGNVPWNKGRKHSAETLRRIRERTRIAMQDPKVRMKLVNLGHAQSEETRIKIGIGVRVGWQRRRDMLVTQESCHLEWQNMIAEASRKGYAGEGGLQWDSYKLLDKQLKQEWLESVEKRKTMPRQKGSKRAPKSLEQRRKISEAISAKWTDPEYRNRVYTALSKYHGTTVGVQKPRRKQTGEASSRNRIVTEKICKEPEGIDNEAKGVKRATHRKKKTDVPSFKDPMAISKLKMVMKIRAERVAMETRKKEATEKAKLLIAEAEKAARALEVAALTSPLAQASLLETWKLIAEATRSIEGIERGQPKKLQDNGIDLSFNAPKSELLLDGRPVNGSRLLSSSDSDCQDFGFFKDFKLNERDPTPAAPNLEDSESVWGDNVREESSRRDESADQPKMNGFITCNNIPPSQDERGESSTTSAAKVKKWVCGRLVEVEG